MSYIQSTAHKFGESKYYFNKNDCKWSYRRFESHYHGIRNAMNVQKNTKISFTTKKQHFIDKPTANAQQL